MQMSELLQAEELFAPGHRACPGCGQAIAMRLILRATGRNVILSIATGCLETFATRYPATPFKVPVIHSLFENAAAVASGIEAALDAIGRKDIKVIAVGGDGATFDIGFGMLSGMLERGHDVLYICLDNCAYMNTGIQRSSATPLGAATTTTPPGKLWSGKEQLKKDVPAIVAAHGAKYVAVATVGYPMDLVRKVKKAMSVRAPSYIQVYTPCPTGEGFDSKDTIKIGRLAAETGVYPIFEIENGEVKGPKIRRIKPVEEYLRKLRWFRHLFESEKGAKIIEEYRKIAKLNVEKYYR